MNNIKVTAHKKMNFSSSKTVIINKIFIATNVQI